MSESESEYLLRPGANMYTQLGCTSPESRVSLAKPSLRGGERERERERERESEGGREGERERERSKNKQRERERENENENEQPLETRKVEQLANTNRSQTETHPPPSSPSPIRPGPCLGAGYNAGNRGLLSPCYRLRTTYLSSLTRHPGNPCCSLGDPCLWGCAN